MDDTDSDHSSASTWQAYSDYGEVTHRVSASIEDAVDAYATLEAMMSEGANIEPERAADCRRKIQSAAMRILVDMRESGDDQYKEIIDDWIGSDESKGYIQQLQNTEFGSQLPGWLFEFVLQIRQCGWRLGYVRAGRREKELPDDDEKAEAREMFDDL